MNHFKGKQFKKDVIIVAVGYYLRYNLSYREVQELLYDRGINVCHTTIYRWVQEYGKLLYQIWKKKNKVGCKSTAKSSMIFGRRKIDNPSIHGKWTKPISKLRDVGIIFIVQLMRTA
ncbi:transposase for insertion sequence-like element IS431mec [Enterococcus faecalis EnGen0215]|nr:transposase for insertion sequence-like element IS431mec [Enterococcus faecalis EnGen0215]